MRDIVTLFKRNFKIGPKENSRENDRREFQRFNMAHLPIYLVTEPAAQKFSVLNLSYGGILLDATAASLAASLGPEGIISGRLECYHLAMPFETKLAYQRQEHAGLSFLHQSVSSLAFLRNILEFVRIGQALGQELTAPPKIQDHLKMDHLMTAAETRFEVSLKSENKIERFKMGFKGEAVTCQLEFIHDHLVYRRYHDDDGDSLLALQAGLFILVGLLQWARSLDDPTPLPLACLEQIHDRTAATIAHRKSRQ